MFGGVLQQLISQQAALVAAAAQGSTFVSPVAALSSPHVTVGSLTAMANGALPQPAAAAAAAAGNGITTTAAAGQSNRHLASAHCGHRSPQERSYHSSHLIPSHLNQT